MVSDPLGHRQLVGQFTLQIEIVVQVQGRTALRPTTSAARPSEILPVAASGSSAPTTEVSRSEADASWPAEAPLSTASGSPGFGVSASVISAWRARS